MLVFSFTSIINASYAHSHFECLIWLHKKNVYDVTNHIENQDGCHAEALIRGSQVC